MLNNSEAIQLDNMVLCVYKPVGITSFQVIRRLKSLFKIKRIGHCGTLDPFASGIVVVCLGKATRIIPFMENYDKSYACTLAIGASTDTQDTEGVIISGRVPTDQEVEDLQKTDFIFLKDIFSKFEGSIKQLPPMYSALKKDGRPLYEYARQGIEVERKERLIKIYRSSLDKVVINQAFSDPILGEKVLSFLPRVQVDFSVSCSKGTYIRTICHDIGEETGWGAHAIHLKRYQCGPFSLEDAWHLEDIEQAYTSHNASDFLYSPLKALSLLPTVELTSEDKKKITLGQKVNITSDNSYGDFYIKGSLEAKTIESTGKHYYLGMYQAELVAVLYPFLKENQLIWKIERMLVNL